MCHSRALSNKVNRLHERCLRLVCNSKQLTFEERLEKDDSVSIHIRTLAIEKYKVMNGSSPEIMEDVYTI